MTPNTVTISDGVHEHHDHHRHDELDDDITIKMSNVRGTSLSTPSLSTDDTTTASTGDGSGVYDCNNATVPNPVLSLLTEEMNLSSTAPFQLPPATQGSSSASLQPQQDFDSHPHPQQHRKSKHRKKTKKVLRKTSKLVTSILHLGTPSRKQTNNTNNNNTPRHHQSPSTTHSETNTTTISTPTR